MPKSEHLAATITPAHHVSRIVERALSVLGELSKRDPATAHHIRRALFVDACAPLTPAERLRLGNIFRASLFQRQELDLYWLPTERHITTRRTIDGRLLKRKLPTGAIFIGSYRDPFPESGFLEDLEDLLASMRIDQSPTTEV